MKQNKDRLDTMILEAVRKNDESWRPPIRFEQLMTRLRYEVERIADAEGRDLYKVLDVRLQALKRSGSLVHGKRRGLLGWMTKDAALRAQGVRA